MPTRTGPPDGRPAAGRCCPSARRRPDPARARARAEALLERHGVRDPGRGRRPSGSPGGFAARLPGAARPSRRPAAARRGYFVEGLGAAQFALARRGRPAAGAAPPSADSDRRSEPAAPLVLAATDPANPYGAALPWPERRPRPTTRQPRAPAGPQGRRAGRAGRRRARALRRARRQDPAVLDRRPARWRPAPWRWPRPSGTAPSAGSRSSAPTGAAGADRRWRGPGGSRVPATPRGLRLRAG